MSSQPQDPRSGSDERASLRPFWAGLWFGGFNGLTWMIGLGTPMVLIAQRLGADAFQVGLASAFVFLLLPVQVLATSSLARLGYRRQMVLGWGIRALFLLVPLALALHAPARPAPWMAQLFVASVFGFCFFRAFGVAAHIPWFAAMLPASVRGRFFATDAAITSVVGVATLLLCAWLFAQLPPWRAFAIVYALAMTGSALAIASLQRLPPAPAPAPVPLRTLHREVRRLCFERGPFRYYLALCLLGSIVGSSIGPFTAYYLRVEAELPSSRILGFTAAQFAGQIVGGWSIRLAIDRAPLRRFFMLATLGTGVVELFWLLYVSGSDALAAWLPAAYLVFGLGIGVQNTAHYTYLPELSEERRRPVSIAVFTATLGVLSGLAPMLWGLGLRGAGPEPSLHVARFALFFGLGLAANALLLVLFARLRDPRGSAG